MKVTKFNYPIENSLIKKIDLMIDRCTTNKSKKDSVLIIEGGEGEGKTTYSIAISYYVSEKTGRSFGVENVFFDLEKMIKFAQSTEKQIIIWDEPALQGLSTDWASAIVKNLTRLLMMARKKRHFIIINMTKFYKFNEYIVVDRAIGLIHIYSRNNIESGRFMYIKKKNLEPLWRDYRYKKRRNYNKYSCKHIRGTFPDILNPNYKNNVLKGFEIDKYESMKDEAIASIGTEKDKASLPSILREKNIKIIKNLQEKGFKIPNKELKEILNISMRTIQKYTQGIRENAPEKPIKDIMRVEENNPNI